MEVGNPGCVIGNVRTYENDASLARTESYAFYRSSFCTDRERCKNCVILPVCLGRCPRTWNEFYDCERLKGNLADTMIKVYDLFQNIRTVSCCFFPHCNSVKRKSPDALQTMQRGIRYGA